jgi:peptidoglycan/LPS O-acetylase OafA/YrhL
MEFYPVADNYTHQFPTHLRLDALAFGVLLGYGRATRPDWFSATVHRWRRWLWAVAALLLWPPFVWDLSSSRPLQVLSLTTNYLGFGALLLASLDSGAPRSQWAAACFRACGAIGAFSYSIYLWHADVFYLLEQTIPPTWAFPARLVLWLAAALTAGAIMSLLVEKQSLRLRDRFFPSRSRGIGLAPNTRA